MKKTKRKAEFNPELRAQGQENRRLLAERIAYHEKRRMELRRERGETQA
jgi:hypothetical protein